MKPIEFEVKKIMNSSPKEVCEKVLDIKTWSSFNGHGLIPGIEKAEFEKRTDKLIGSIIRVKNSDGTEHLEEILEWKSNKKLVMKISDFPTALSFTAKHFIEEWNFEKSGKAETLVTRRFQLFPTSFLARPLLMQIAGFMERAIDKHLDVIAEDFGKS